MRHVMHHVVQHALCHANYVRRCGTTLESMSEQNRATIEGLRSISLRTSLTTRPLSEAIAAEPPPKVTSCVTAARARGSSDYSP